MFYITESNQPIFHYEQLRQLYPQILWPIHAEDITDDVLDALNIERMVVDAPVLQPWENASFSHVVTEEGVLKAKYAVTATSLADLKNQKQQELAAKRYAIETGGIVAAGAAVKTDRQSQAMIAAALQYFQFSPTAVIDWKGEAQWYTLNAQAAQGIAQAVGNHVQHCFATEKTISEMISAATSHAEVWGLNIETLWNNHFTE